MLMSRAGRAPASPSPFGGGGRRSRSRFVRDVRGTDGPDGGLRCDGSCSYDFSQCLNVCGNGVREGAESCDGGDLGDHTCGDFEPGRRGAARPAPSERSVLSDGLACTPTCEFDLSGCDDLCGNGRAEEGEDCDGEDLGDHSCADDGRTGTMTCTSDCNLDDSACTYVCGNGVADPGEECDGEDVRDNDCSSVPLVQDFSFSSFPDYDVCTDFGQDQAWPAPLEGCPIS